MEINNGIEIAALHNQPSQYEPKLNDTFETFIDDIKNNPGLRLRVGDALSTVDIHPQKEFYLGYHRGEYILPNSFYRCIGVNPAGLSNSEQGALARTFLLSCCELRDGMSGESNNTDYFNALPESLKVLALLKLIDGGSGSYAGPGDLPVGSSRRVIFGQFVSVAMPQMAPGQVEGLIDASILIHAPKVLDELLRFVPIDTAYLTDTRQSLQGVSIPKRGLYLGDQMEDALRESDDYNNVSLMRYWSNEYSRPEDGDAEHFAKVNIIIDKVGILSEVDEEDMPYWRDYVLVKLAVAHAFKGQQKQGFSGSIDQLVTWVEAKPDEKYPEALVELKELLTGWERQSGMPLSREALAYGLHDLCIRTIEDVEHIVVYGDKKEVRSRIATVAIIIKEIAATTPELAEEILGHSTLLRPHIQHSMDPWQTRYR